MTSAILTAEPLIRLGCVLLHSLWQLAAIGLLAWAILAMLRRPAHRYGVACAALLAMLAAPAATFVLLAPDRAQQPVAVVLQVLTPAAEPIAAVTDVAPLAAAPVEPAPPLPPRDWHTIAAAAAPYVVAGWSLGVLALVARHAVGWTQLARLRRRSLAITDRSLLDRLVHIAARLGIRRRIALLACAELDGPAVVGWLRPAILWPAAAMTGLTPTQLDAILAHELAHIRRHDYAINLLQTLVETLLFYHPATWWLSRRIRQEREHCCDDIAATLVGGTTVAGALVALETQLAHSSPFATAFRGGRLMNRVQRLLKRSATSPRLSLRASGSLLCLAAAMAVVLTATWQASGDDQQSATQPALPEDRLALTDLERDMAKRDETLRRDGFQYEQQNPTSTRPATAATFAEDYKLAPNDLVQITVLDLAGAGKETIVVKRIPASGKITLPYLAAVPLQGLTEAEAERSISKAYKAAQILPSAVVTVVAVERQDGRNVPIVLPGGVVVPTDPQNNSPPTPPLSSTGAAERPVQQGHDPFLTRLLAEQADLKLSLMRARQTNGENSPLVTKLQAQLDATETVLEQVRGEHRKKLQTTAPSATAVDEPPSPLAIYRKLQRDRTEIADEIARIERERGANDPEVVDLRAMLRNLDLQIDQQVRPVGEIYVSGIVQRAGVYSLSGRKMMLRQLILSAGGIGREYPEQVVFVEIVRRENSGETRQQFTWAEVRDTDKGTLVLVPDDQVRVYVGTTDPTRPSATRPATRAAASATPAPRSTVSQEIANDILQRGDAAKREAAIARLKQMLGGDVESQRQAASALMNASQVKFDKAAFTPLLRGLIDSTDPQVRAIVLQILPAYGGTTPEDVDRIARKVTDESPLVRSAVPAGLLFATERQGGDVFDTAIRTLLADPEHNVRREALRCVWGVPLSEQTEAIIIDLSRQAEDKGDAAYFALSTRPQIRLPVAKRMAELLEDPDQYNVGGRIAWGSRNPATPEAWAVLEPALLAALKDSTLPYMRNECARALVRSTTPTVMEELRRIAEDESEPDDLRQIVGRAGR